ncbi:MAG TPA: hemerythrin domain-containing protein [Ornithinibacter sp.]|nr:hemerythrin domain-containing protein [Ornithinibacter sp.]
MTDYEIPRPDSGDVVDLIIADHRLMEDLLRELRDATADRESARTALAELLVAHGESEEEKVYPTLDRERAISAHEVEHGEEEHAEGNEALLALLECEGTDTQQFDDAVEELATALNHHIGEEEQTILNPARTEVSEQVRQDLGRDWVTERNRMLDQGCASVEQVREVVERAVSEGTLAPEEAREEADAIKDEAKARAKEVEEEAKQG